MKFRCGNGAIGAATFMLLGSVGCAGGIDPGQMGTGGTGGAPCVPNGGTTTPPATFATVKEAMQGMGAVESCSSSPCHAKGGMVPFTKPLVLQQDADLYRTMTTYVSHACGDVPFVTPGKPTESAFVKIISGPCGAVTQMPYQCVGEQCLPAEYVAAITQWVANCAPEQ